MRVLDINCSSAKNGATTEIADIFSRCLRETV
jgi:hypothetical protein